MGGMKGSLVGDSEAAMRAALKVISAVSGDRTFFVVTCNNLDSLPPELKSRFTAGTWFFDLPDAEERDAIWKIHLGKYELVDADRPDDEGWTGREIRQCCDLAWRLECSLAEAAAFVVPVSKSAKDTVDGLRTKAVDRFISASYTGTYRRPVAKAAAGVGSRKVGGLD
jgi:SpoVK/Ycf46/Vps4 family AAA+-type ATPase